MFVWMSWNFARFHEILNQTIAENFSFLSLSPESMALQIFDQPCLNLSCTMYIFRNSLFFPEIINLIMRFSMIDQKTSKNNHLSIVNRLTLSLAPIALWPHTHFGPKHTSAWGTFWPEEYFTPNNTLPRCLLWYRYT